MRKRSAKLVPKCLNADQKRQRCQSSEKHLEFSRYDQNDFLSRLVIMDETWLCNYDPETKQQSMEWRHSGSSRPQKIPSAKIRWEISRLDFFGSRRHPPHSLSSKGPDYQHGILLISTGSIERHFEGKTPPEVHPCCLVLVRHAPAHRTLATQKKLAYLLFQYLDDPPYSPDLAPPDYHLFPGLKKTIGRSDTEVIAAAETWLDGQDSEFF